MIRYVQLPMLLFLFGMSMVARGDDALVHRLEVMGHDQRWNSFVDQLYALHEKLIAGRDIKTSERIGGYYREPKFFREVTFTDAKTGRVISRISWERAHPDRIHVIQVYLYDKRGRVTRDYTGAYRTTDHDSPQATEINLHAYQGKLHAFRQFNASNEINYEKCTGSWNGKPVDIRLDDEDLANFAGEPNTPMTTPEYAQCFAGLPESAGKYLIPR